MTFAAPLAFWLALAALPIIGLYILKVRLRRIPVSTNMFWKQMLDEKPPRAWWQTLRHLLSLLAQLLILVLLLLALADPFLKWQSKQARRLVLIIDSSASMLATDVSPSRFEAARSTAQKVLDGVRQLDEVAIVVSGNPPQVVLGMGNHIPTLRNAVQSLQPSHAASPIEPAVRLARQLIGDRPNGQILVFTDGCAEPKLDAKKFEQLDLSPLTLESSTAVVAASDAKASAAIQSDPYQAQQLEAPGSSKPLISLDTFTLNAADTERQANLGITQLQVRRSLVDPIGYEILVSVFNASDQSQHCRLELELDGVPVDVLPLSLEAEQQWSRTLEKTSLQGGILQASLTEIKGVNALEVDDRAWAILQPQIVQKVLIVSPGNLFVQKVFEANPLADVSVTRELPEIWPSDSLIVLHRLIPPQLPPGDLLVLDPESACELWDLAGTITTPILTDFDDASPLMTHVRLDNVQMPETRELHFKLPTQALASTLEGHAVMATVKRPNGKCLVMTANLEKSDLAFRTVFPIWIANALNWYAGRSGELEMALPAGQMGKVNQVDKDQKRSDQSESEQNAESRSADSVKMLLLAPDGDTFPVAGQAIGPFDQVGIWCLAAFSNKEIPAGAQEARGGDKAATAEELLSKADGEIQRIAVNLSSVSESDLRPTESAVQAGLHTNSLLASWFSYPLWFYLVLLVGGLSVVEWALYQRRVIT